MRYIFLVLIFLIQSGCAIHHKVMVGDEKVIIKQTPGTGKHFVHLHQNERTALKAAEAVIHSEGGSLLTLVHSGQRNIVFHLNHKRYEFDPNRIYTDKGIKKTLKQFGNYSPAAHREVKKLALKIEALLPDGKIIAVHNNNTSYSLKQYLPGHELSKEARAVHMNDHNYFRNFFLVTKLSDYIRLKAQGFNEILQKTNATDDGSLSVLMAKKDYINVEAGYDQYWEQIKMLLRA